MKKEDLTSLIVYLLMIALAVIIGFTLVKDMFEQFLKAGNDMKPIVFALLTIVGAVIINSVGLELGHIIGGKIGGYSVVSVNVLAFCFYKKEGKWKFGFRDFDGLTGETILAPKKEKANPKAYIWLPLLLYFVELIGCIVLYTMGSKISNPQDHKALVGLATASIIVIALSSMMAIYNFVPFKLDSMTDGYRLTLVSKPINVEAYNELMRIENLQREGKEVTDVKVFDEVTEFTASINLITVYNCLAKKEYEQALKLINKMIEQPEKMSHVTLNRLIAQKIYINILTQPLEKAREYYESEIGDELRRFISNDISMEAIRAYVLIAGILDESFGEVQFAHSKKAKALKRALKSRAKLEETLYNECIELIKQAHPDWDMSVLK